MTLSHLRPDPLLVVGLTLTDEQMIFEILQLRAGRGTPGPALLMTSSETYPQIVSVAP